ncbi:MAG: CoA-binding protein [Chroococcales cyanobacterium]
MPNLKQNQGLMEEVLKNSRVIAVVGYSDNPRRTSYSIGQFLEKVGYTVYPVNPTVKEINGKVSYPSLKDVPEAIDIVNVFRRPEYLPEIVEEAIAVNAKTFWAQLGIYSEVAKKRALEAGLNVIMDACIKIEWFRFQSF